MNSRDFCAQVGIRYPIVQAPIGGASSVDLVCAVSGAGGLGMLSGTWRDPALLCEMIGAIQTRTHAPFGVNFVLEWDMADRVARCIDAGVRHFSFFWGDPAPFVDRIHRAGGKVWCTVSSPKDVRPRLDSGVDVLVAQGWEAGGHVEGSVSTMALVPRIADLAGGAPVVAAGGIADGRGIAAACCLGASAVWLGTAFLMAREANVHPVYRDALAGAEADDAVHTTLFDGGWPNAGHRVLRNDDYRRWVDAGCPAPGERPGEGEVIGIDPEGDPVLRYTSHLPRPGGIGHVASQALYSGQGVGLLRGEESAADLVRRLAREAASVSAGLGWLVQPVASITLWMRSCGA
ncbi:MAG: NAD(P)H-dependent flavin oxidoreductase, partial [Armatimonadaceae bacterium]